MALFESHAFSETLGMCISFNALIPQATSGRQIGVKTTEAKETYPVLYLLHGLSDDHSIWLRRTSIERYAAEYGIAVIMPNVHRSWYTNMHAGLAYWDFISEELPVLAESFFPVSTVREERYVAGLSMGGYGAFKLGLSHPQRYAAAASLSGALDMVSSVERSIGEERGQEHHNIFGDPANLKGSQNDLLALADKVATTGNCPHLHQCCGTEDFLYEDNLTFKAHAESQGLPLTYKEGPGSHEWGYWDTMIQDVLAWLPLPSKDA